MPARDELCRLAKRTRESGDCHFPAAERHGRPPAGFQYFVSGSRLARKARGLSERRRQLRSAAVPEVHFDAVPRRRTAKRRRYESTELGPLYSLSTCDV